MPKVTIDPAGHTTLPDDSGTRPANPVSSETHDPFKGIEFGRSFAAAVTIGTVTIAGGGTANDGVAKTFTASFTGNAAAASYAWSATGGNAANVGFSATNVAAPSVTFTGAGTYNLQCVVTDATASDSPATGTLQVVVN